MNYKKYARLREEFHRHPELSGAEIYTAEKIIKTLESFSPAAIHTGIGGQGIIAEFCFSENGPNIFFRADIDAVSLSETISANYISQNPGVAHKCGHDGHTTILLAFADLLHQVPFSQGRILLLFQPSEENGKGANSVLASPYFQKIKIDRIYALHNLPGYPLSSVICRTGSFTCSVISCSITINGKTAHAAEPEKSISPLPALLEIWHITETWNYNHPESPDYFRSTLIELHIGEEIYGVAAGKGIIRLTFRAAKDSKLQKYKHELEKLIKTFTSPKTGLSYSLEWLESFTASKNTPEAVQIIQKATERNGLLYQTINHPFPWGEDFGLFTQQYSGAMFGLGAGINTSPLHTPEYDFPNEIIKTGAELFYQIAQLEINP